MYAAWTACDETVAFLLSKGASPDLMDVDGNTALIHAIRSSCSFTIALLAPVTSEGLRKALAFLSKSQSEPTPAVKDLLRKAALDQEAVIWGISCASTFGATKMLKILTKGLTSDLPDEDLVLTHALNSDNPDTVQVILATVGDVSSENIALALTRGRADVVKLFGLTEDYRSIQAAKKGLKQQ